MVGHFIYDGRFGSRCFFLKFGKRDEQLEVLVLLFLVGYFKLYNAIEKLATPDKALVNGQEFDLLMFLEFFVRLEGELVIRQKLL